MCCQQGFVRLVAASALLALLNLGASPTHAREREAEGGLRLTWRAPPGCPSLDEVRTAVLRDAVAQHSADVLEAEALVEQKERSGASAWTVRLRTQRGTSVGEREIEASTCFGVADATAVVLALALVPPAAPGEEPSSGPPTRGPDGLAPRRLREDGHRAVAVGLSLAADPSTLPAATAGGSLSLAWVPGRARLEIDARQWASRSRSVASSDAGARFSMTTLGGRACWTALRTDVLRVGPCAGADVSFVSAEGQGADENYAPSATWTTLTGGALGGLGLTSWLALRARAEAFVPLTRPTFVVRNEGHVHRPPAIGAAATLGVEVNFL